MAASTSSDVNCNILDVEILKIIKDTIRNPSDLQHDHLLTCLKETALEPFSAHKNTQEILVRKKYALFCLTAFPNVLNDEFCLFLCNGLWKIFKTKCPELEKSTASMKVDEFIATSNVNDKLLLLRTITVCLTESEINFSVFEAFSPNEWRKELLIYALFSESKEVTDQHAIKKINDLTENVDNTHIIDLLEVLVCTQNEKEFDTNFLNDIFFIFPHLPHILTILSYNVSIMQDEICQMKMNMFSERYSKFQIFEKYASDLKFFLKYPLDVIQRITTEKKIENIIDLLDFKAILEIWDTDLNSQIQLLLRIDPNKTIDNWKYEVAFEIVKSIISDIFPVYEKYCWQINNVDEVIDCVYAISSSKIACTCFNVNKKCILHHSTECCDLLFALNDTIARVVFNCTHPSETVIEVVELLIIGINKAQRIIELINALDILGEYNIQFTDKELYRFFSELQAENYEREIHKYVVEHTFPGTYEKSIDQLLNEIEEMNPGKTVPIIEQLAKVTSCYRKKSAIFFNFESIEFWDKHHIQKWSKAVRRKNNCTDEEILAVINRAAKVTMKLKLRDIQLLSILIMINSDKGKGRLAQVNTGEGKTLIIAILTAFSVFKGHKVDVYTSSPLLAIPQSKEFKEFYETCGVSVTHNILPNGDYTCDVVYGTNHSFQRDVLQDEFRKSGVRKARNFDIAIVDEVDNMLIDGNNWILKLSCDMPAMDYLEVLLAAIYIQVNEAASCLVERNGEVYYLMQESGIDEQGNVKQEVDVQEVPIKGTKRDFIIECTETHIRKLIRDTDSYKEIDKNYPVIKIPEHLREVICKVQLRKWIVNAINAIFIYVKGEDYIIKDGKVTIVDADNTGVVKKNSHWCAGLHQFLEIKHGAKVHQESFTTNFMSNLGLFTRYTSNLYGLTGTLGSNETRLFLQSTYDVDSVVIPPFKLKQHQHLKAIVVSKEKAKYMEIAKNCIRKLRNGRAVLIIMKYIKETDELAEIFTTHFNYDSSKVKLFKTDEDSNIVEKPLQSGDVIITTNIAGRGTDIKLSKDVEKNGGLHVCLTFLPVNTRVEHQNIGRTSRKGNRGTSQIVLYDREGNSVEIIKMHRSVHETRNIKGALDTVRRTKIKDKIFKKFCDLLGELKCRNSYTKKIEQKAVEERFAIWLIMKEDKLDNKSGDIFKDFNEFKREILDDDRHDKLIKNPYMHVELGNEYLNAKKFEEAIEEYTRAIVLDHHYAEHAYYNRAWAYVAKYGHDVDKYNHFINEAVYDLKKARKLIENKEYSLHLLQTASKGEIFSEQISHKLNLYNLQKNTIELAIGPDIEAIDEQLQKLKTDKNNDDLPEDYRNKIPDAIKNLEESKKNIGVIGRAKKNNRDLKIEPLGDDNMPQSDIESHKDEIQEFQRNGWIGGFKITEIKPIDWFSVLSLLGIGLVQLITGAAVMIFSLGAGSSIGMGLILEGINDIITAITDGIINRDFDWATWAITKIISVTISIVCAGFKAITDAAKTAYAGVKNTVTLGAKAFTQTTKQGWKLVAKKIGVEMGKRVAKEIVTNLATYGIDKAVLPMIEETIIEAVRKPIQEALINSSKVTKMLKLDEQNQNHNYENQIRMLAQSLLTPETNSMLKNIATQIATRVADNKGLALTRQICNGLVGVCQLTTFTSDFINKMNEGINKIKITSQDSKDTGNSNDEVSNDVEDVQTYEMYSGKKNYDDIDLKKAGQQEEQIKLKKKVHTTNSLTDYLSSMVSTNLLQILKGQIIAPITQMGVNYSIDKLSSRVNGYLEQEMENYRSLKNVIHCQNKAYKNSNNQSQMHHSDEIKKVDRIIDNVKNGGPAGLAHLGAVSAATDRPIEVYDEKGRLKYIIGDNKKSPPVEVQYHEGKDGKTGHFTLKGCREPYKEGATTNMCLFNVVAEQTGQNPDNLKQKTLNIMEKNKSVVAKQVKHIKRLEMYDKSSLIEGGAQYNGKHPDHAKDFLKNSNGVVGFGNIKPGHAEVHVPFKGKTIDQLNAIADETGRQIEVYDKKGKLDYIIGVKKNNDPPIKLEYHKPKGDTSAEYFSSKGGNEKYYLHDQNDINFYNIISSQTGANAANLKTATLQRMDQVNIPPTKPCIENESKKKKNAKCGFVSEDEQAFVLHHAMQTDLVKQHLAELNKYEAGVNASKEHIKREVRISAKELNLPRQAMGGRWRNGTLKLSWPVTDVMLVIQHYKNHENNSKARVHVQTFYPFPP